MCHRCAKQRHELVALRVHINLVDNPIIHMDHLLCSTKVGIEYCRGVHRIIPREIKQHSEGVKVGKEDTHRAKLANLACR